MNDLSEFHAGAEDAAYAQGYQDGAMAAHAKHDAEIDRLRRELAEAQAKIERLREWVEQNDPGLLDEFDAKERKP